MSVLKIKDQNNDWIQIPTIKGDKGDPFTYADFTPEQLETLKGKDGISPTVSVVSDTSDDYRLSFTDETHTVTTPNLIPEAEKILSVYPHDTASGSIASFPDGADNIPLKSCIVRVEPVQDLHGYDSPWPAGGGKNLFNKDDSNSIVAGYISLSMFADTNRNAYTVYVPISPNTTYTVSKRAGEKFQVATSPYAPANGVTFTDRVINSTAASITITSGESDAYLWAWVFLDGTDTGTLDEMLATVQIELGATATSYAPCENLCPISGWEECKVIHTGKNLCDSDLVHGIWTIDRFYLHEGFATKYLTTSKPVLITGGTTCYVSFKDDPSNPVASASIGYVKNNTVVTFPTWFDINRGVFTVPNEADGVVINLILTNDITNINETAVSNFQVELGSTATDYSPYTGRSITIDLGQTVYGGKLDVLSGKLTVYPEYDSYNGETLTGEWISDRDVYAVGATPTIGAQVVNIGAQGVTVQLEPHEVKSLYGVNNLWADSGDTEVTYRADTKLYIEKLTQPEENDMIADSAINIGQFFMIGNSLYRALANIASGATITVGTNAQRVSLSDALNLVNA